MPDFSEVGYAENLPDTGIEINDKEAKEKILAAAQARFDAMLDGTYTQEQRKWTRILDAVTVAGELFTGETSRSHHRLILLSDMVEDSPAAGTQRALNFATMTLDQATIKKIIDSHKAAGMFPNLNGARVYVAGAKASSTEKFVQIEKFWREYFKSAGAVSEPGMYVRDGLDLK
jgi:hypothetical protein